MSSLKRYSNPKKERKEIAIQSEPIRKTEQNNSQQEASSLKQKINTPIKSMPSKILANQQQFQTNHKNAGNRIKHPQPLFSKSINLNMMKLQNSNLEIYSNISLGDVVNRETYLSGLQDEIENLRKKIVKIQEDQHEKYNTMCVDEDSKASEISFYHSRTNTKKSLCGQIYSKGSSPYKTGRRSLNFLNKGQEQSTFFKWKPQVEDQSKFQSASKEITYNIPSKNTKNPEENKNKNIANYRVKNSIIGQIYKYKQKQTRPEPEQNKQIFITSKQWQITSINDDFRQKISKKLQIPSQFPIDPPNPTSTLKQYQDLSMKIYSLFNLDANKFQSKLIVRKFKNGVYYQMKPNKNIVWYFNGAFYLGDWETDLPSQGEKNGFGFQYIPNKYFYLGQFKNGMRDGKGAIKIISANSQSFMAYDGQWLKGKPHGFGKHIDQKGNKYIGNFQNGEKTGNCLSLTKEGLFYQGQIKNGLKNGKGTQKLVNGDQYNGQFLEGKFQGEGTYKWKNGSEYTGQFVNGKRQGKGKWKSYNGDQFEGQYLADIKQGWGKFTWANGQIYEGEFRNDIRNGEGTYKHPNGKIGKFMWKDGQIVHRIYCSKQQQYRCRFIKEKQFQNIN